MVAVAKHTPDGPEDQAAGLRDEMRRLWHRVIERRAPHVLEIVQTTGADLPSDETAIPCLQAVNIWFQLTRIIDENTAMRSRRMVEATQGPEAVEGSFAKALTTLDPKMTSEDFAALTRHLSVGPTITAHPTEAKRVTVLEIHRRIYRHLVSLETQRWTPRERDEILQDIEAEIDLLWMTGELRMERPSLRDEIEWGLQFFRDALYDAVPQLFDRFSAATEARFGPGLDITPCVRFHSWIGGDRDGNPNVTAEVTRDALARARRSILARYQDDIATAAARISITSRIVALPPKVEAPIRAILERSPDAKRLASRNPGEVFRQALTAIGAQLRAMQEQTSGAGYPSVSHFIADLRSIEAGLEAIDAHRLATRFIAPLRFRAETFGFRTTTLDVRQNSTVVTAVLSEVWALTGPVPAQGSPDWARRLRDELGRSDLVHVNRSRLGPEARELLDLLTLMRDAHISDDPEAIGPFILSMTRSAEDVLAVYLLARHAGFGSEKARSARGAAV